MNAEAVFESRPRRLAARPARVSPARRLAAGSLWSAATAAPWPVILLVIGLVWPPEISFYVGGLRLTGYRLVLLALFAPCLYSVLSGTCGRLQVADWLMLAFPVFAGVAIAVNHGPAIALEPSGIFALESAGAYFLARRYVRTADAFIASSAVLVLFISALAVFTVPESFTGRHLIRELAAAATGQSFHSEISVRMGMHRAFGPFQHPILYGVSSAAAFGLSWYVLTVSDRIAFRRLLRSGIVVVAAVVSFSSGALAALFAQFLVTGWDRVSRGFRNRWWILVLCLAAFYLFVEFYSNRSGIRALLSYVTFSQSTAYGRIQIWNNAIDDVMRNPLFGIGFKEWTRPAWLGPSIDNFWLAISVRYGLPAFACLAGAQLSIFRGLAKARTKDPFIARIRKGWVVTMIGMIVAGCTVHFWNQPFVIICFLIGMGVSLLDPKFAAEKTAGGKSLRA